jgi:hypothetical protein
LSVEVPKFEKNVTEPKPKSSNFERTQLKPLPRESSHKFLNVKTWLEVLSKRKNPTTLDIIMSTH